MIVDYMKNRAQYPFGKGWEKAFAFLSSMTPDIEEGEYRLLGDDVFARVMAYETRERKSAVLEAHRRYVDVQAVITGQEGFEWYAADTLTPEKDYDEASDAEFYRHPDRIRARIDLFPGMFAVFFLQDAHMPSLIAGEQPERIKKVVVKIRGNLLIPG